MGDGLLPGLRSHTVYLRCKHLRTGSLLSTSHDMANNALLHSTPNQDDSMLSDGIASSTPRVMRLLRSTTPGSKYHFRVFYVYISQVEIPATPLHDLQQHTAFSHWPNVSSLPTNVVVLCSLTSCMHDIEARLRLCRMLTEWETLHSTPHVHALGRGKA